MSTGPTTIFSPNTKIRSSQVNQNFLDAFPTTTNYSPSTTLGGTFTSTGTTINVARSATDGEYTIVELDLTVGLNGGAGTFVQFSLPDTALSANGGGCGSLVTAGVTQAAPFSYDTTTSVTVGRFDGATLTAVSTRFLLILIYKHA